MAAPLSIIPADKGRRLGQFIRLPQRVYADDPHWIAPLYWERRLHFSALNPFFRHGRWGAWLACRGAEPVGRISAQIDDLH
ncbi:MAG: N-acetyltransferase, partial [Gammaproteobacteria bacterium]